MTHARHKGPMPVYQRLYDHYHARITTFDLAPGERFPSISEIQHTHAVSREPAKRVLRMLAEHGYIITIHGKGSYIADLGPTKNIWALSIPFTPSNMKT